MTADQAAQTTAPARRRRWPWVLGIVGGGLVLGVVLLIALLPMVLSSGVGRGWVTGLANGAIPGRVEMRTLRLSWSSGIGATGVTLADPEGDMVVEDLSLDAPRLGLWRLVTGSTDLGEVSVRAGRVALRQPPEEPLNLQRALMSEPVEPAPASGPIELPRGLSGKVIFTADQITYDAPDMETVELSGVEAVLDAPSLEAMTVRLGSMLVQAGRSGRIDARFDVTDLVDDRGALQVWSASVDGTATLENLPVAMADRLSGQGGSLVALLGPWLSVEAKAQGPVTGLSATLSGSSPNLRADLSLTREPGAWSVASGGEAALTVTPEAVAAWSGAVEGGADSTGAALLKPVTATLTVQRARVPMDAAGQPDLARAELGATLTLGDVEARSPGIGPVAVRGGRLEVSSEALGQRLTVTAQAEARVAGRTEPLSLTLAVTDALSVAGRMPGVEVSGAKVPLALADAAAGLGGKLVTTLGPSLEASLTTSPSGDDGLAFEGVLSTQRMDLPLSGELAGGRVLRVTTPRDAALRLTPEAWSAWMSAAAETPEASASATPVAGGLELVETVDLALALERLEVALPEGDDAQGLLMPGESSVSARLSFPSLVLREPEGRSVRVSGGSLSVQAGSLAEAIEVALQAVVEAVEASGATREQGEGGAASGQLSADLTVRNLFDARGRLQTDRVTVAGQGGLREAPSALIDGLLHQGGRLATLLGPVTTVDYRLDYAPQQPGEVTLDLASRNTTGRVAGRLTADGRLELVEDATLSVRATPEISREMLGTINPLLRSVVSANAPLNLVVRAEGFSFPLTGSDWLSATADATLDLGELTLAPEGQVGALMSTLGRFNVIPQQRQYSAQVAPLDLALRGGALSYRGMNLAISEVDLGFSGAVNLVSRELDLRMRVGGEALADAGLGSLDLALGGTIDRPQLNTEALAQALIEAGVRRGIRDTLREELGPEGEAVGGVLDAIFGGRRRNPRDNQNQDQDENNR